MGKSSGQPMSPVGYEGLFFDFSAIRDEISNFARSSEKFIVPGSRNVLNSSFPD
jgi:hypothetical protein